MKQLSAILASAMVLFFSACNNSGKETDESKTKDSTKVEQPVEKPAFSPYNAMVVEHPVKDFDKWLPIYEGHDTARKKFGLTELALGRGIDKPNDVFIAFKADDIQKAKEFAAMPDLKAVMQKAGVIGPPKISYINVIRDDNTKIDQQDRVMVAHKVKDFDAWLKVYDGEGKDTRAANGIIDRVMARGVDDPNMVYLVFAITDMAKAKARMNSPELKKLMTDAGVQGAPTFSFYKIYRINR